MISSSSSRPIYRGLPVVVVFNNFTILLNIFSSYIWVTERDFSAPAGIPRQSETVCVNTPSLS